MATLPITRLVLFKHGVGYFERRGAHSGEQLALSFPREAMDDVLKSLITLELGTGQVLGVEFATPEDRAARRARGSIHLSDERSLLDLLRDLRGRAVRCSLAEGKKATSAIEGLVVGVDYEPEEPLRRAMLSLYEPATRQLRTLPVAELARLELLDDAAADDLDYVLRAARSDEQRRAATLRLSPGEHEVLIGYIAPAPAWRVSYRLLFEEQAADQQGAAVALLQGWGLFDNQLDEDLNGVALTLMAGMPVSFRYRLYAPHTPERPLIADEERTVEAPISFASAPPAAPSTNAMLADSAMGYAPAAEARTMRLATRRLEETVQSAAAGEERAALFAYRIAHPVSVARGQSAMVPIVSQRLPARRELLYNGHKLARHPIAVLRLTNATGLTLERGPVTVLEAGDYAGEAVLPFTRAGGELIVAYAVELGISVEEERRGERQLAGISLRGDYALIEEHELAITSYELTSNLDRATDVTVEHQCLPAYTVIGPRPPDEEGAGLARWRVACAPQARTSFSVTERRLVSREEAVRSLTGAQLRAFLTSRLLDTATVLALGEVLKLYQQVDAAETQLHELDQQREAIFKQQRQIRGNLEPLGREGEEGALRQRYVATLGALEDRLATLAAEEARLRALIARLEEQAAKRLQKLASA